MIIIEPSQKKKRIECPPPLSLCPSYSFPFLNSCSSFLPSFLPSFLRVWGVVVSFRNAMHSIRICLCVRFVYGGKSLLPLFFLLRIQTTTIQQQQPPAP